MAFLRGPVVTSRIVEPQHPDVPLGQTIVDLGSALSTGQSGTSASILQVFLLSGTSTGHSTTSAAIRAHVRFIGSSTGHSTASGAIRYRARLTGASTGHSSASGAIRSRVRFTGASVGQSTSIAAIRARVRFTGASTGLSTAVATLTYLAGGATYDLTGLSVGQSTASAILTYIPGIIIPLVAPVPNLAGNGRPYRGLYYGQQPRRTLRTLREKKRELIRDLEAEERERQGMLAVAKVKKAQLARLQELVSPRAYRATAIVPTAMKSIANSAQRAIDELRPVIAEKERQIAEHARKEKEIEELLLLDVA